MTPVSPSGGVHQRVRSAQRPEASTVIVPQAAATHGPRESRPSARARLNASKATRKRWLLAYALVTPVLVWRLATAVYPFFETVRLSFRDNSPIRRTDDFVGLANYRMMLDDPDVHAAISFTIFFTVVSVSLQVVLGLGLAELLNREFRFRGLARAINLLPWAMSGIVVATAAKWIFDQNYGLVNDLIWRVSGERPLWLTNVLLARLAVVFTDVWKNTAFMAIIFLGGLQGIPRELHDAATIDGASRFRAYWSITFPLMLPLIASLALFAAIYRILSFEVVYALTSGGPGTATALLSYLVYLKAFRGVDFGYASALAIGLFLIVLVVGLIGFAIVRRAWSRI